jgi:predicted nicotinamide N-methyase
VSAPPQDYCQRCLAMDGSLSLPLPPGSRAPRLTVRAELQVRAVADPAELSALRLATQDFLFEQEDLDGWTGGRVWEAGEVLARTLASPGWAERVRGARVLELGAGTGLVGLTCAGLGAESVCMTDLVLFVAEHNLRLNFPGVEDRARYSVRRLEWGVGQQLAQLVAGQSADTDQGAGVGCSRHPFDLIVTADTLYLRGDDRSGTGVGPPGGGAVEKLAETIAACAGEDTLVVVAAPEDGGRFFAAMASHGAKNARLGPFEYPQHDRFVKTGSRWTNIGNVKKTTVLRRLCGRGSQ